MSSIFWKSRFLRKFHKILLACAVQNEIFKKLKLSTNYSFIYPYLSRVTFDTYFVNHVLLSEIWINPVQYFVVSRYQWLVLVSQKILVRLFFLLFMYEVSFFISNMKQNDQKTYLLKILVTIFIFTECNLKYKISDSKTWLKITFQKLF